MPILDPRFNYQQDNIIYSLNVEDWRKSYAPKRNE